MTHEPMPRWSTRLLERFLEPSEHHVLGDLEEDFAAFTAGRPGAAASRMWLMREVASLVWAVLRERRAEGRRARRSEKGEPWEERMMGMRRDMAQALRGLLRAPGFTVAIGLTLAITIGATTTIFSVANAAFLKPLPFPDADRMVSVYSGERDRPEVKNAVAPLDWRDFSDFPVVVEATAAWSVGESVHMTDAEQTTRLEAPRSSLGLFDILGARPVVGRYFTPEEMVPDADDAVVLSHGLWERAFGADPSVINRTVELDGRVYRVVGVAPSAGMLPRDADLWRPLALGPEWYDDGRWGWQFLSVVARLRPTVDLPSATRALNDRLAEVNADRFNRLGQRRVLSALYEERSSESGAAILMLLGAVLAVLAMACANVITVTLVRSEARMRELALRRALGSGAGPLARMVGMETLLLALAGGVAGVVLARLGLQALGAAEVQALAALGLIQLDGTALLFASIITVGTTGLIGVGPVLTALRTDPQAVLKEGSTRSGGSRRSGTFRDGLVVLQVSLAFALLVTVGISAGAFQSLVSEDPGFEAEGVLTATLELPAERERIGDPILFYRGLLDRLESLPGVTSVGATNFMPLDGVGWSASFSLADADEADAEEVPPHGNMRAVTAGYFESAGIPLVEGRAFTEADAGDAALVAIVDETVARRYWPEGSPVGRQAVILALSRDPATIVGVVGDVPDQEIGDRSAGHVYFPLLQAPQRGLTVLLRTSGDPAALAAATRQAIRETDERMPVTRIATFEDRVADALSGRRLGLLVLMLFGATAVLLAAIGVYGVVAYTVSRRTSEIGTRMALGAAPRVVLGTVVGRSGRLWAAGTLLGIGLALLSVDFIGRFVAGVETGSVVPYVGAVVAMGCTTILSAGLPALRAIRVDPVEALRSE